MLSHALIDYYNLPYILVSGGVLSLARSIDFLITSALKTAGDINIRLYGGWYNENGLSKDGTLITQEIGEYFPFSLADDVNTMRYLRCEIASSILDSREYIFPATLRKHHGLDLLSVDHHPEGCKNPLDCPIHTVIAWSRKKKCPIPGCSVRTPEAFICNRQKLVDSMICCDLINIANSEPDSNLFLVSDDDDFIPALISAGNRGSTVWHVRTKLEKIQLYDDFLIKKGVRAIYL
jgi:hypothetical protein